MDFNSAVSSFGSSAKTRLANPAVVGQPEDQLRTPFSVLLEDLAEVAGIPRSTVTAVGETSLSDLKIRPDFSITVHSALVGHVELKAPGKGADPRRFRDQHDREQWTKLQSLPNLIYSDGNQFSLWRDGELARPIVRLIGDIEDSGASLRAPPELLDLFEGFLRWQPIPPRSAQELAKVSARLCRLLRDEVLEQLELESPALTRLAVDWRRLLFPEATNATFADGYAQAVTFGLLMARAKGIPLNSGFHSVARDLGQTSTLIGAAMRLLTDDAVNQSTLHTSLQTLTRVLHEVDWATVSRGDPESWLYFYEDFLEVYDNDLRKQTGSYYTPPEVVNAMVHLVDQELRSPRFGLEMGVASSSVTLADPATGTGTFMLGILKRIAETVTEREGAGAVAGAINDATRRLIAFEMQLGPFAVAQLRILAEIVELTGSPPTTQPRMFVTNTLDDPEDEEGWIPGAYELIASSRKDANRVKREEPITVVIGNPPYKERARGLGGWVEGQAATEANRPAPLRDWMPPTEWRVGVYARHLRSLYVYFWRWATWKVFDHGPGDTAGIVCFISMSGFLGSPGFQRMRSYLRQKCDRIWVIDCSPEGHQPEINTRIFQGVQQPVCIVLASRRADKDEGKPAEVRWRALPKGHRSAKFAALARLTLTDAEWTDCPTDLRAPFLPISTGDWTSFPALEDLFNYNGAGVMAGRTWISSPDQESLKERWNRLIRAPGGDKEVLFHPHLRRGKPGDKHVNRIVATPLSGFAPRDKPVAAENGDSLPPVRFAFRSFDRQWIIPDSRVINQPNPELWAMRSPNQVFMTAPSDKSPSNGPALTVTALIPDVHHYNGRGGRFFALWSDKAETAPNIRASLLDALGRKYGERPSAEDFFCYVTAIAAQSSYTARFKDDLSTPGLRIPLTADLTLFREGAELGRWIVWLHTFGERMADATAGRPSGAPRLPTERRPFIPADGSIPIDAASMPDNIDYDTEQRRLHVGSGYVENVLSEVWNYEVSGKHVIRQWFSYRQKNRERPLIGDRRPPSPLASIQPDHWLSEYTTELINLLNVLGWLVELEPKQSTLLDRVCSGALILNDELRAAGVFEPRPTARRRRASVPAPGPQLFDLLPGVED